MSARFAVVSTSLNPESGSRIMVREVAERLRAAGALVDFIDLQEHPLPLCDGGAAYDDPRVKAVEERLSSARGIVLGIPVYNFQAAASAKNLIELAGDAFEGKAVAFACKGAGRSSYMAVMGLIDSLILDYRCYIVPRFVYADNAAVSGGRIVDEAVGKRLEALAADLVRLSAAVALPA